MSIDERRQKEDAENNEENEDDDSTKKVEALDSDSKSYGYLLGMPLWSLTFEKKEKLEKEMEEKKRELEKTKKTTIEQFWHTDLDNFSEALDKLEDTERKEEEEAMVKAEKKQFKGKGNKLGFDRASSSSKSKSSKLMLKKECMPSEEGVRYTPRFEAPKTRKESGEAKAEKAEKARIKKEEKLEKERIKKEKEDKKSGKGSKKLDVDYGFVNNKMEKTSLNDDVKKEVDTAKGKANLSSKPKKSALKREATTKKPPKKRKKMDWESDSDEEEADDVVSDGTISVTDSESDFKAKLPSRKSPKGKEKAKAKPKKAVVLESDEDEVVV